MKMLRTTGAAILLFGIGAVLLIALTSPQVKEISGPLGQAGSATARTWREKLPGIDMVQRVAGNGVLAVAVGLGLFVALMVFIPSAGTAGRGRVAAFLASAAVAFVLYQPSVLGGGA